MMRRRAFAIPAGRLVLGLALLSATLAGCSGPAVEHGAGDQLQFGVRMAQQGLWSEALFRFEKARQMDPGNPRVLNNIAVALEAAGRYDEALEAYREALRVAPGHRGLSENYARFVEFYESFRPVAEGGPESGQVPGPVPGQAAAEEAGEEAPDEEPPEERR
jgi:tetratricopeptide (TPR) repeat protein